jgi:hypothetical protein
MMYVAARFKIAKIEKQTRCEWINKHGASRQCKYSAVKRSKLWNHKRQARTSKTIFLSESSRSKMLHTT